MKTLVLLAALLLTACTSNAPHRLIKEARCQSHKPCDNANYEYHPNYELAFVEYSERGNDFNPEATKELIKRLTNYNKNEKLALIVFIHGWKHNAAPDDDNVISFNKALDRLAKTKVVGNRRLVGVYVGWRGMSFHGLQSENLSYWDRKETAEEVGRGGVTELLTRLERIDRKRDENYLAIVGHSFGGAITLSALHDQLMDRMISAQNGDDIQSFGDGVILLNPAIEATQGLLLKENSLKVGMTNKPTPSLLYVVSSEGDIPTHWAFPAGQYLDVYLTWNQTTLYRRYLNQSHILKETEMDTTTIGNFPEFWTGQIVKSRDPNKLTNKNIKLKQSSLYSVIGNAETEGWRFISYCNESPSPVRTKQFPCLPNEPADFIYTDKNFISGHNDIFNDEVISLLTAVVAKSNYKKIASKPFESCTDGNGDFSFGRCFDHFLTINKKQTKKESPSIRELLQSPFGNALK